MHAPDSGPAPRHPSPAACGPPPVIRERSAGGRQRDQDRELARAGVRGAWAGQRAGSWEPSRRPAAAPSATAVNSSKAPTPRTKRSRATSSCCGRAASRFRSPSLPRQTGSTGSSAGCCGLKDRAGRAAFPNEGRLL